MSVLDNIPAAAAVATLDGHGLDERAEHPHDAVAGVPDRLPIDVVRSLSVLRPAVAVRDIAVEWLGIAAAISLVLLTRHPLVYVFAVIFIGARQHALTVLGHDAAHYRLFNSRSRNDVLGDVLLQWPMFIGVEAFRRFHGAHHRHTNAEGDGNRFLWRTHDGEGNARPEWVYPKTRVQLLLKLLRRGLVLTGLRWLLRGILSMFVVRASWPRIVARVLYYGALAALLSFEGWWLEFVALWLVPLCTWHIVIQYMRLIAEHSAIDSDDPAFAETRTTIATWWERLLILPRNIGYHIEHHWYPSVPYYNLPALHQALMQQPRFREHAVISRSIFASLGQVIR